MNFYLAYSLANAELEVVILLRRQAQTKGIAIELSSPQVMAAGSHAFHNLDIRRTDFVLAIVTKNGNALADTENEIVYAKGLGKPVLGLFEKGVSIPLYVRQGITYVTFDRHDIQPAALHLSSIIAEKKRQKDGDAWGTGCALAIAALVLLGEED